MQQDTQLTIDVQLRSQILYLKSEEIMHYLQMRAIRAAKEEVEGALIERFEREAERLAQPSKAKEEEEKILTTRFD